MPQQPAARPAPAPDNRTAAPAATPGGPTADLRGSLRGMNYADGAAAVRPDAPDRAGPAATGTAGAPGVAGALDALPEGVPKTREEIQDSLDYAGVSATSVTGKELGSFNGVTVSMLPGTRMHASVGHGSLSVRADPGLQAAVPWCPDAVVNSLRYNFHTASFTADAEGLGPDALYSKAVAWVANKHFKPKLPGKMQRAGYDPGADPQALETFKSLGGLFDIDPAAAAPGAQADGPADMIDPAAELGFHLDKEVKMPIGGGEAEMAIPAGARFHLSASFKGDARKPKVERISLSTSGKAITLRKTEGMFASLQGLDLNGLTILPGGQLKLDYDLVVEQMAVGAVALFRLFAAAAGDLRGLNQPLPQAKMEGLRKMVDDKVAADVQPQLVALLKQYDKAIPGVSLSEAFGL